MITDAERRTRDAITVCDEREPLIVAHAPLTLPSVANLREHHHAKRRRTLQQRAVVGLALRASARARRLPADLSGRLVVRITREAPRALDDDNAASACKGVRDSVAEWLGVDDRDERVCWLVAQAKAKTAAVVVEIYAMRGTVTGDDR